MFLLVATSAIAIPLFLLVIFRMPARIGMSIAAGILAILAVTVWQMDTLALAASAIQGAHRALTIGWILFGALFFLQAMDVSGYMNTIKNGFFRISSDMRIQAVLVAFLFVSLLEGVAGFGTPAAITVPLLIALGFRPLHAVALALIGDSVAVSFGAIATPLYVGLENVVSSNETIQVIAQYVTRLDMAITVLLPSILIAILIGLSPVKNRTRSFLAILPWSLFIGTAYALIAILAVRLLGPAFASIIASIGTFIIALLSLRFEILTPKQNWTITRVSHKRDVFREAPVKIAAAWVPYLFIIILLVLQRVVPYISSWLNSYISLSLDSILGFESISSSWPVLASPGSVLFVVAVSIFWATRSSWKQQLRSLDVTTRATLLALLALIPTLIMIQIFTNSGYNNANLNSMPSYIAIFLASHLGAFWGLLSPMLGMLTSFITGSSTVSNLTMSPIQYNTAIDLGLPVEHVLAQQVSGANAGNMIAIHNVIAALTAARLPNQEWKIIRVTAPVALLYVSIGIISALCMLFFR